jgi:hypothetical protein
MSNDNTSKDTMRPKIAAAEWLAIRKEAALHIDPETAEVMWTWGETLDPYGIEPDLPNELRQIGREYFARSPGSDVWVWFGDLPDNIGDPLWEKHRYQLAFPAGLPARAFPQQDEDSLLNALCEDADREVKLFDNRATRADQRT